MTDSNLRLGILGHPLGHSMSPYLHEYLLQINGLTGCYQRFDLTPERLPEALSALKVLGFRGVNVTVPYKKAVMPFIDEASEIAASLEAVNTLTIRNDKYYGDNTDIVGFCSTLKRRDVEVKDKRAVIFGAGGAARAVIWALVRSGIASLHILNRNESNARALARELKEQTGFRETVAGILNGQQTEKGLAGAALAINATPVGMWPGVDQAPYEFARDVEGLTVIDLIYNPLETLFLRTAREWGARTLDGLDMFVYQAFESLRLWVGSEANLQLPFEAARRLLTKGLKQK